MQFAVVDIETTGVFPARDRVVEVAIVALDQDRKVVDEYATLVNPQRDVGPTSIHGIQAGHVHDAPTFQEIAGDLAHRLGGRLVVGHNARFDTDFLREEFNRVGVMVETIQYLCTLRMAYALEPDAGSRKLGDCCRRAGVEVAHGHSALQDARSAARLFDTYVQRAQRVGCRDVCEGIDAAARWHLPSWAEAPAPSGRSLQRDEAAARMTARRNYLGRLIQAMPGDEAPTAAEAGYLELLDRALADRAIEPSEAGGLLEEARRWDLTSSHVIACHHLYMRALVGRAVEDGIVTESERNDIDLVASLLGVSGDVIQLMLVEASGKGPSLDSLVGKVVCFTGEFAIDRLVATQRAENGGVVVVDSVTKKTHLLVAADPESLSGKAGKARKYGIPIISEADFWARLGC